MRGMSIVRAEATTAPWSLGCMAPIAWAHCAQRGCWQACAFALADWAQHAQHVSPPFFRTAPLPAPFCKRKTRPCSLKQSLSIALRGVSASTYVAQARVLRFRTNLALAWAHGRSPSLLARARPLSLSPPSRGRQRCFRMQVLQDDSLKARPLAAAGPS